MAHRTQTGRRLHPYDTPQDTVLGLRKFNVGPVLAPPTDVEIQEHSVLIQNAQTVWSPVGYWTQTSVARAATPLLLKNSFAQLGHAKANCS